MNEAETKAELIDPKLKDDGWDPKATPGVKAHREYPITVNPITREERVATAQKNIFALLNNNQKEFLEFVLTKYIETGVEELDQEKLPGLLELKYQAVTDAAEKLGGVSKIRNLFIEFQKHLYQQKVA